MNTTILALRLLWSVALLVPAFKPVDEASSITFSIKNMGFQVTGSFTGLEGGLQFDPANPAGTRFDLTVHANTITTGITARDNHLRKEEYLYVDKYPMLRFLSSKIEATPQPGRFQVWGTITVKGVAKAISFPFTAEPRDGGFVFTGKFRINRRDFGVGGNSLIMSDNLDVMFSIVGRS